MTEFWRRLSADTRVRLGYLLAGLTFAAVWMAQSGRSPLDHVIRLLLIMAVAMSISTALRHWAARRGRPVRHHSIGRFLLFKLALLALGLAAGIALEHAIPASDVWVGIGLGAVTAVAGPLIHPWLAGTERTTLRTS